MIFLETERLYIRDHKLIDLEPYHRLLRDNVSMKFLPDIKSNSLEESKVSLNVAIDEATKKESRTMYFLGIFLKDNTYVGEIGYTLIDTDSRGLKRVHLGYFIHREFWNRGIVSEALAIVLDFAFTSDSVGKVETGCLTENIYSERLMIKNGFSKENFIGHHTELDGVFYDRVEYSLTHDQYLGRE